MAYTRRMDAEIDEKQLKKISLGQKVRIVTEGEVCELRDVDSYDLMPCGCATTKSKDKKEEKKEKIPARITIKIAKTSVETVSAYDALDEDED